MTYSLLTIQWGNSPLYGDTGQQVAIFQCVDLTIHKAENSSMYILKMPLRVFLYVHTCIRSCSEVPCLGHSKQFSFIWGIMSMVYMVCEPLIQYLDKTREILCSSRSQGAGSCFGLPGRHLQRLDLPSTHLYCKPKHVKCSYSTFVFSLPYSCMQWLLTLCAHTRTPEQSLTNYVRIHIYIA